MILEPGLKIILSNNSMNHLLRLNCFCLRHLGFLRLIIIILWKNWLIRSVSNFVAFHSVNFFDDVIYSCSSSFLTYIDFLYYFFFSFFFFCIFIDTWDSISCIFAQYIERYKNLLRIVEFVCCHALYILNKL